MTAKITISRKQAIEHNDPEAAGWTRGYWWTVSDPDGNLLIESGSPTRADAEAAARQQARNFGYLDAEIVA